MLIGDFSKLSFVTVKALRYYDEIGLLKPERVDEFTGYRYYSASQLPRLNRIVALKNMGLSLEEIARLLRDDVPVASILDLLHAKQSEIKGRLQEEVEKLARVEEWLRQTETEGRMPEYEVITKKIKSQKVLSIRRVLPNYGHLSELFSAIGPYIGKVHAPVKGPPFAVFHDKEFNEADVDVEVAFPLWREVKAAGDFKSYEMAAAEVASVTYKGPYENVGPAYNALMRWVEGNNYQIAGPNREVYMTEPGKTPPSEHITEIQVPIERNKA
jgi:DNA-binding transcriptional MerR regulator/predicted transcriptional regulator YdeE